MLTEKLFGALRRQARLKKQSASIKKRVKRQLKFLSTDIRHPSLYAKKMKGTEHIWEARIDYHHRMTFQVDEDRII